MRLSSALIVAVVLFLACLTRGLYAASVPSITAIHTEDPMWKKTALWTYKSMIFTGGEKYRGAIEHC